MQRLVLLITPVIILVGSILFGLSDSASSIEYTSILNDETTNSQTEARNSSASATIMITMYTVADE